MDDETYNLNHSSEVVRLAGEDFDAWCRAHEEQVGDLDMLEQIEIYSKDSAWHSRETQS